MSIRYSYSDIVWVGAGQVLSAFAMLAMMKVWSIYLEPNDLGLMALIVGIASILLGISFGPLFHGIFIFYNEHAVNGNAHSFRAVSSSIIKRRGISAAILIGVVGYPISWYFGLHWSTPILVAGLLAVDVIRVFEQRLFAASRRHRDVAMVAAGDAFFRLCFVWIFLHTLQHSPYTAIVGNQFGAFLFVVVMRISLRLEGYTVKRHVVPLEIQGEITNAICHIAKPLLPSMVLANLTEMGNRYIITAILGLHAAGLFVVGYGFVKRPYGMLNNIGEMTMVPGLRWAVTNGSAGDIVRSRRFSIMFISSISIIGALLFFVLRDPLVTIFLSGKYADVSEILFGLAVAITLFNVANVFNWFSLTLGDSRVVLLNNVVGSITTVVLTIVLCLMYGLIGTVWALIIGYSMQLVTSIFTYQACKRRYQLAQV